MQLKLIPLDEKNKFLPYETIELRFVLLNLSTNVIVRLRDESKIKLFTELFKQAGYKEIKSLREECWKNLTVPTDDFYLYLYSK